MSTNQNKNKNHIYFMRLALEQAKKVLGNTKDNPAVGCVITKNNHVISAGHTSINGRPHAEHNAINLSKKNFEGSKLYVTLEPCSHYGKTPPCVNTIIKSGIKRVFFSSKDPDPRSYNKSTELFKKNKIVAKNGILYLDIRNFYKSYIKYKENMLPFVTAKMAVSKDLYTINRKKKWITNIYSRGRVHLMRSKHDCILTAVNTIITDNPRLTCRILGLEDKSPSRIILDKSLKIPLSSYVVKSAHKYRTFVFFNKMNQKKIKILKRFKVKLIQTPLNKDNEFDLKELLTKVRDLGFSRIFLETGIKLTNNFLDNDLVDVFHLFISKKNLGNNGKNNFKNLMRVYFKKKKFFKEKVNLFDDKLISYHIK